MTEPVAPAAPDEAGVAPQALTLDDTTLRSVFPAAPKDTSVPRDVRSLFKVRMRGIGADKHRSWVIGSIVASVVALILAFVVPALGVLVIVPPIVWGIIAIVQYGRAKGAFFARYAEARGLQLIEDAHFPGNVPLLHLGDKRHTERQFHGDIGGYQGALGMYTYTVITHERDSEGNMSKKETDHDFTVLRFELPPAVAQRFVGVYLKGSSWSFGALGDKLAHDRAVKLESVDFHKRYSLRVVDSQDDIALYELFSPTFIEALTHDIHVYWEQVDGDLVFLSNGHESEAADLDSFCLRGTTVLRRYLEEHR